MNNLIAKITLWAQGIIVALIVGTILEMILPSGNNKKYIKMMIGLYVLYTIISPVVKLSNINIDSYEKYLNITTSSKISGKNYTEEYIKSTYVSTLKENIKAKVKEEGYTVKELNVEINDGSLNYGEIKKINLKIEKDESEEKFSKIKTVSVTIEQKETLSLEEKNDIQKIKQLLSKYYEIDEKNVNIEIL